jgi:hypothetical protein
MQLHGVGRCPAARNYSPSGARAMRTVTAVPLNATVTSLLAVSPKCREGRRRRRLTCSASRRSPRRRGAAERRRAGPVDSPSKSRRFGRDKELGESAIRNSAGRRSGSRSATTAAPRPSHEIRSRCLRAERHCRCDRARRLILWRRAGSRRDGYDLLACTGLPPVRRDHPEAGLTRTRKAVASLRGTCPAPDAPVPGWQRTAR